MSTPTGADAAYMNPADLQPWMNFRTVGQILGQEANIAVPPATVPANALFGKIVKGACGLLESSALRGKRYTTADISGLSGNMAELRNQIVAGCCWMALRARGGRLGEAEQDLAKFAGDMLDKLTNGERIFAFAEVQEAAQTYSTDRAAFQNNVTSRFSRYFGRRNFYGWR